jgi:hypothetical protein
MVLSGHFHSNHIRLFIRDRGVSSNPLVCVVDSILYMHLDIYHSESYYSDPSKSGYLLARHFLSSGQDQALQSLG